MRHPSRARYYKQRFEAKPDGAAFTSHLLQIEDVMVEVILQLLVCIVDAKLLEAVGLKVLEAKNVQDADG